VTRNIPGKATAAQFKNQVKWFYWHTYGRADINVYLKMYDAEDKEVTSSGSAKKLVYTIELRK